MELTHLEFLESLARDVSLDTRARVRVVPAKFWIGGELQPDYYEIRSPGSVVGPASYQSACDYLQGIRIGANLR